MKTAFCFFGHFRTFRQNNTVIEHLVKPNGGDVYLHTYSKKNTWAPTWHGDNRGKDDPVTKEDEEFIRERFGEHLVTMRVDPLPSGADYAPESFKPHGHRHAWASAHALRVRSGMRYDLVFSARLDLWLDGPAILKLPKPHTIYGSHRKYHDGQEIDGDVFLYGGDDEMTDMCTDPFPESLAELAKASGFYGERLTTAHRKQLGYAYEVAGIRHGILRPEGVMRVY